MPCNRSKKKGKKKKKKKTKVKPGSYNAMGGVIAKKRRKKNGK
jgi:hypothetical protein